MTKETLDKAKEAADNIKSLEETAKLTDKILSKEKPLFRDFYTGEYEFIPRELISFIKGGMASYYEGRLEEARAALEAL